MQNTTKTSVGVVDWFGGNNHKTGRKNQFGFINDLLTKESLFVHKKSLDAISKKLPSYHDGLVGREFVLYDIGERNGKPEAINVEVLTVNTLDGLAYCTPVERLKGLLADTDTAEKLLKTTVSHRFLKYLVSAINDAELKPAAMRLFTECECVIPTVINTRNSSSHTKHLYKSMIVLFFKFGLGELGFKKLIDLGAEYGAIPDSYLRNNMEDVADWLATDGQHLKPGFFNNMFDHLNADQKLMCAAKGVVTSFDELPSLDWTPRGASISKLSDAIEEAIQDDLHKDSIDKWFGGRDELSKHPLAVNIAKANEIRIKIFKKDLSFAEDVESCDYLKSSPEFTLLAKMLPMMDAGYMQSDVEAVMFHWIWQGVINESLDINHEGIYKLFPRHSNYDDLSCEAFVWETPSKENIFLCRGSKCNNPQVMPNTEKNLSDFNVYDWLKHYGYNYRTQNNPAKADFPIKMAAYLNRVREIRERLDCRCCGKLMKPDTRYARSEKTVFDRRKNEHVVIPSSAAYRLTVWRCEDRDCAEYMQGHYINHCIGFKCQSVIDSRDNKEQCSEGRYICDDPSCGKCCTIHQDKFGYSSR